MRQRLSKPLEILMAMVGLVLLIACANVANLLLGRATTRRQEIAVRIPVGAGRTRLIRALLTESVLLAALGGSSGLRFAAWGTRALLAMSTFAIRIEPDARVLGFTAAVSLLTGLLFGLAPAFRATLVGLQTKDRAALPLPKTLVVVQVALSLMLLIGAGLFARTLRNLNRLDAGFERDHVLVFLIDTAQAGSAGDRKTALAREVLERMGLLPGARSMSVAICGMFSGCGGAAGFSLPAEDPRPGEERRASMDFVGPFFFKTMGIPMLEGRDFTMRDDARASKVVIVNQHFARRYFPGESPPGKRFALRIGPPVELEIVGVVKDARIASLKEPVLEMIYLPLLQRTLEPRMVAFRTVVPPYALAARVREELRMVNSKIQVREISTMAEQVDASLSQERMLAKLAGFFAVLALVLACVGLYGVLSYSVARRTREIGVRMARGAGRTDVLTMVLRESLKLAIAGVIVGVAGALAVARYTSSMLWGLTPHDPKTIAGAATLVLAVTLLAAYIPARKAARVDPMIALRSE